MAGLVPSERVCVCHVGFSYFPGQGQTYMYECSRHLAELGVEVHVISAGRFGKPVEEVVEGVNVHRVPVRSLRGFSQDRLRFIREASNIIEELSVDIFHVYAFPLFGLLPWLGGRHRATWLYDIRTSAAEPPLIRFRNWLTRYQAYSFDHVVALSPGILDVVFGSSHPEADFVPLGANFQHFRPLPPEAGLRNQHGISPSAHVLVYCGTLVHGRGIGNVIKGFAQSAGAVPDSHLLLIGTGSELEDLQELARGLQIVDRVTFTDYIPYSRVPRYFSVSDIGLAYVPILPRYDPQPPTKTVEYLAAGLPVIATNTAGNRSFIRDRYNGMLVGDSPPELAEAIVQLLQDQSLQVKFRQRARLSVKEYDWRSIVQERLIPVYQKALESGSSN